MSEYHDLIESALSRLQNVSSMMRGMQFDPAIPQHAKDALMRSSDDIDEFIERTMEQYG
jgi:hypothetical protein